MGAYPNVKESQGQPNWSMPFGGTLHVVGSNERDQPREGIDLQPISPEKVPLMYIYIYIHTYYICFGKCRGSACAVSRDKPLNQKNQ